MLENADLKSLGGLIQLLASGMGKDYDTTLQNLQSTMNIEKTLFYSHVIKSLASRQKWD